MEGLHSNRGSGISCFLQTGSRFIFLRRRRFEHEGADLRRLCPRGLRARREEILKQRHTLEIREMMESRPAATDFASLPLAGPRWRRRARSGIISLSQESE